MRSDATTTMLDIAFIAGSSRLCSFWQAWHPPRYAAFDQSSSPRFWLSSSSVREPAMGAAGHGKIGQCPNSGMVSVNRTRPVNPDIGRNACARWRSDLAHRIGAALDPVLERQPHDYAMHILGCLHNSQIREFRETTVRLIGAAPTVIRTPVGSERCSTFGIVESEVDPPAVSSVAASSARILSHKSEPFRGMNTKWRLA